MNLYRMSKQQELDGDALPERKASQKSELSFHWTQSLSSPFPHSLPCPIPVTPVENHPLKLVSPSTAWDPGNLDSVQMLFCLSAVFTFRMGLKWAWGQEMLEHFLMWWNGHRLFQLEVGSPSLNFLTLLGLGEWVELDQHPCSLTPDSLCDLGVEEKKGWFSLPPPSPNTLWDYSGIAILGLTLFCLVFGLHPAVGTGGMEMPAHCWSEETGMPFPPKGGPKEVDLGGWGAKGLSVSLCFPGMVPRMRAASAVQRHAPGPRRALGGFEVFSKPISDVEIWLEHMRQANHVHLCLLKMRSPADWV